MRLRHLACILLLAMTLGSMTGCGPDLIELVDEGRSFERAATADLLSEVEPPESVRTAVPTQESRTRALTALRRQGRIGNDAADLITRAFPSDARGVPFYVERAQVDGTDAWIVAEAIGPRGEPATDERLWVLDVDGAVLFSATR